MLLGRSNTHGVATDLEFKDTRKVRLARFVSAYGAFHTGFTAAAAITACERPPQMRLADQSGIVAIVAKSLHGDLPRHLILKAGQAV
jgi:hypothetical protein